MGWFDPFDKQTQFLLLLLLLLSWLLLCPLGNSQAQYGHSGGYLLPASSVTPGKADHELEADPSRDHHLNNGVEVNICAPDFRTGPFRHTSESVKRQACAEYGVTRGCPGPGYEIDHLISLELGGADVLANLWLQPIKQARIKDHQTEDKLPKLICSGRLSLQAAQACISADWVTCAVKVKKLEGGR